MKISPSEPRCRTDTAKFKMPKCLTGRALDGAMTVHFVLKMSRSLATSGIAVHIAHSVAWIVVYGSEGLPGSQYLQASNEAPYRTECKIAPYRTMQNEAPYRTYLRAFRELPHMVQNAKCSNEVFERGIERDSTLSS